MRRLVMSPAALGRRVFRPAVRRLVPRLSPSPSSTSKSRHFSGSPSAPPKKKRRFLGATTALVGGAVLLVALSPRREPEQQPSRAAARPGKKKASQLAAGASLTASPASSASASAAETSAWPSFAQKFEGFSNVTDIEWSAVSDRIVDMIVPDWSKLVPGQVRKLQRELSVAPGSLAEEIWRDAQDPLLNPEVQHTAQVRVSEELCDEEKAFRARRKRAAAAALGRYLGLDSEAEPVHPDDVPVIALCGSGGGLRALVAGTGSYLAAAEDGLYDCVTYTGGVSGSCWLQALFFTSFAQQRFDRVVDHLRARLGVHIAYPPDAFSLLTTAPTNRPLLAGVVEKLRGDPGASFGIVDVYGVLLAARLLVPKGELDVDDDDFKISHQRRFLASGQYPMPIYTAVRHEIPDNEQASKGEQVQQDRQEQKHTGQEAELRKQGIHEGHPGSADEQQQPKAPWFQWLEITPYEFFCEELSAGIPTWAMGRRFRGGRDVLPKGEGDEPHARYHLPETRLPLLLGVFGSAFCATLSHYYREIRPVIQRLSGLQPLDELIWGRNDDLSKVHPIEPATVPNPVYGLDPALLPATVPPGMTERAYIQLMDAGMSNNLPLYPMMRPGRGVEVVVVFDASADIRQDNWLRVADGYARQRGVQGWPVGAGWPHPDDAPAEHVAALRAAQQEATPAAEAAKIDDAEAAKSKAGGDGDSSAPAAKDLGYCTVWVGTMDEKKLDAAASPGTAKALPATAQAVDEDTRWRLSAPDAGLTLIYLPFLANERRVPGVDPTTSEYMSTWNFVYSAGQVDAAVALARANYSEGADQIRSTVRAVYERKKQLRLEAEQRAERARLRRLLRRGADDGFDHFS